MRKEFFNARECAEYFTNEYDYRTYPKELYEGYWQSPAKYFHVEMNNKYNCGKGFYANQCKEYQDAKEQSTCYFEQRLLQLGYTLSIVYECDCVYADGYFTSYYATLESVPQQLKLFD